MRTSSLIVPHEPDQDTNIVLDDFGRIRRAWRETHADADKFRKQAKACEEQAAKTTSELDKESWLRFAADWLKLAEDAEKRNSE